VTAADDTIGPKSAPGAAWVLNRQRSAPVALLSAYIVPLQSPTYTVFPTTTGDAVTVFAVLKNQAGTRLATVVRVIGEGQSVENVRDKVRPYIPQSGHGHCDERLGALTLMAVAGNVAVAAATASKSASLFLTGLRIRRQTPRMAEKSGRILGDNAIGGSGVRAHVGQTPTGVAPEMMSSDRWARAGTAASSAANIESSAIPCLKRRFDPSMMIAIFQPAIAQ